MSDLTGRQKSILEYIKQHLRIKGYPPSVREIGEAIGLSSSSTVHSHLAKLEEKGLIKRDPTKPRAIEVVECDNTELFTQRMVSVPLVGSVTAGQPILAVENIEETYLLPKSLVGYEDIYMLTIKGDSMIEAGIYNGDIVLVRKQSNASNGDIIVALLEEEATVKRFFKESGRIRLQPENSQMEPIFVADVTILGKVVGLYRVM